MYGETLFFLYPEAQVRPPAFDFRLTFPSELTPSTDTLDLRRYLDGGRGRLTPVGHRVRKLVLQ